MPIKTPFKWPYYTDLRVNLKLRPEFQNKPEIIDLINKELQDRAGGNWAFHIENNKLDMLQLEGQFPREIAAARVLAKYVTGIIQGQGEDFLDVWEIEITERYIIEKEVSFREYKREVIPEIAAREWRQGETLSGYEKLAN